MKNKEIVVRLSDLLAMLLRSFKQILCITLLLGILGGAYGTHSVAKIPSHVTLEDVEAAEKEVESATNSLARAQADLSFYNEVQVPGAEQKIERGERMILQMQEYMKSSIYYNMDPFHRGAARLCFSVEPPVSSTSTLPEDTRVGIVIAYAQMCPFDSATLEQVRAIMGIDGPLKNIEELISVSDDDDHHVVEICIFYDDLTIAEQAVNYLYQTMIDHLKDIVPLHQINILSIYSGYEVDWELNKLHAKSEFSLVKAEEALLDARDSFAELQKDTSAEKAAAAASKRLNVAQTALRNIQTNYATNRPDVKSIAKRILKHGLLGGLIGFILGCLYVAVKGVFGGIIQNQNEVMTRYAFPLIGVLPRTKKIWFDTAIRKLEGEPTGNFEATVQATIQSLLYRIGEKSVCLVSTSGDTVAKKLAAYTNDAIPVIGSIIDNAEGIKEFTKYEGVVLVEERGKSRLDLVDAEVLRAKALNKEIIGIVLA